MGRITQMIDYLNGDPDTINSAEYRNKNYTKFHITPEAKEARKKYRQELKKNQKEEQKTLDL